MSSKTQQKNAKARQNTKKALILTLLRRKSGASVAQIAKVTSWQNHTIRAALTRLRQEGIEIDRETVKGISRYRVAPEQAA